MHFSIAIRFPVRGPGFPGARAAWLNKNSTARPDHKTGNEYAVDNGANVIYRKEWRHFSGAVIHKQSAVSPYRRTVLPIPALRSIGLAHMRPSLRFQPRFSRSEGLVNLPKNRMFL